MATKEYEPNQQLLFLCTPQDALAEDHLCYFIDEVVEKLDFSLLPDRSTTAGGEAAISEGAWNPSRHRPRCRSRGRSLRLRAAVA